MRSRTYVLLFFGIAVIAAAIYLYTTRGMIFYYDEWAFVLDRPGWDLNTFLTPHNEHLVAVPLLIYKVYLSLFGIDSYLLFRFTHALVLIAAASALFLYGLRRTAPPVALAASCVLLFIASAWEVLLWPFELSFTIPMAAGIGMIVALERCDRRGDILASALLLIAIASSGVGLAFLPCAVVDVLWRGNRVRRLWVFFVPLIAYLAWDSRYGVTNITRDGAAAALEHATNMAANGFGAILGLPDNAVGYSGLTLFVVGVVYVIVRANRISRSQAVALAVPLTFWLSTSLVRSLMHQSQASRYIYVSAAGILLVGLEFTRRARFNTAALACLWIGVAFSVASNLDSFRSASTYLRTRTATSQAEFAAIRIAGDRAAPGYVADEGIMPGVTAGEYRRIATDQGFPAYTESELAVAPGPARSAADRVLVDTLRPSYVRKQAPRPTGGPPPRVLALQGAAVRRHGPCLYLRAKVKADDNVQAQVEGTGVALVNRGADDVAVKLRRFGDGPFGPPTISVPGHSTGELELPRGGSARPWVAYLTVARPLKLCGTR